MAQSDFLFYSLIKKKKIKYKKAAILLAAIIQDVSWGDHDVTMADLAFRAGQEFNFGKSPFSVMIDLKSIKMWNR